MEFKSRFNQSRLKPLLEARDSRAWDVYLAVLKANMLPSPNNETQDAWVASEELPRDAMNGSQIEYAYYSVDEFIEHVFEDAVWTALFDAYGVESDSAGSKGISGFGIEKGEDFRIAFRPSFRVCVRGWSMADGRHRNWHQWVEVSFDHDAGKWVCRVENSRPDRTEFVGTDVSPEGAVAGLMAAILNHWGPPLNIGATDPVSDTPSVS